MLRDDVIGERYHGVEAEQHQQPFTDGDSPLGEKTLHNKAVYTLEMS